MPLDVLSARIFNTGIPEMVVINGTNFPATGYAFAQSSASVIYLNIGCELYGNSGNWTLDLHWYSRGGAVTGSVTWSVQVAAITPSTDTTSVEAKAFATATTASTTVSASAKADNLTSITISANLDNANAGDDIWLKITRTDTSMVGDAILIRGSLSYSDGNSGTAGSGDVVGPASATTTAIALYNGTTGKLLQNSAVTVDPSGNMAGVGSLNGTFLPSFARLTAAANTSGTGLTDITGLALTVPSAGTYVYEYEIVYQQSVATNVVAFATNVTGGTVTPYVVDAVKWTSATAALTGVQTTNNTALVSGTGTLTTNFPCRITGSFVCTASGSVVPRFSSSAGTATAAIGSWGKLQRIA